MPMWGRMLGLGRSEHYNRAIRLFDQELYEEAIASFRMALGERADALSKRLARFYLAEAHTALALSCLDRGTYDRAEAEPELRRRHQPGLRRSALPPGPRAPGQGDLPGAQDALRRALEVNPRYAKALLQMGIALYASGDRAGLRRAEEALALDEAFNKAHLAEARAADARGDTLGAGIPGSAPPGRRGRHRVPRQAGRGPVPAGDADRGGRGSAGRWPSTPTTPTCATRPASPCFRRAATRRPRRSSGSAPD